MSSNLERRVGTPPKSPIVPISIPECEAGLPDVVHLIGGVEIDFVDNKIIKDRELIHFEPKEWKILRLLAGSAGKPVQHEEMLEVIDPNFKLSLDRVNIYLRIIRNKLGISAKNGSIRSVGKKLTTLFTQEMEEAEALQGS